MAEPSGNQLLNARQRQAAHQPRSRFPIFSTDGARHNATAETRGESFTGGGFGEGLFSSKQPNGGRIREGCKSRGGF
jgi:hypothetical protein